MDGFDLIFSGGPLLLLWASQKLRDLESQKNFLLIFSPYCLAFFNVGGRRKSQEKQIPSNVELLSTRIRLKINWATNTLTIPYTSGRNQQEAVEEKELKYRYRHFRNIIWYLSAQRWPLNVEDTEISHADPGGEGKRASAIRQWNEAISPCCLQMNH